MKDNNRNIRNDIIKIVIRNLLILISSILIGYFFAFNDWVFKEVTPGYIYVCLGWFILTLLSDINKYYK